MASSVFDLATVIGVVGQIDDFLGGPATWQAKTTQQQELIRLRAELVEQVKQLRHLEGLASNQAADLNKFLIAHNFSALFQPFDKDSEFGAVSLIQEATRWPEVGLSCPINTPSGQYHGFRLKARGQFCDFVDGTRLIKMPSGHNDESVMWALVAKDATLPGNPFANFLQAYRALTSFGSGRVRVQEYVSISMPEESLDTTISLDWLVGFGRTGGTISQAQQEAHLKVDRFGSEARVATSALVMRGMILNEHHLIIDTPHLVFWTDTTVPTIPIAVATFEFDVWTPYDAARAAAENAETR
jgi:hypothetical protein